MENLLSLFVICCISLNAAAQNDGAITSAKSSNSPIFTYVEQMPVYPGNASEYISANLKYPEEAAKYNIKGRVIVKFVITDSGDVKDVTIVRGIGAGCDEEAARVIKGMGKWKPGKQNGKPVNVYYSMPVTFYLEDPKPKEENKSPVYTYVEEMPVYPGNFSEYFSANLKYPEEASKNNIQGRVIVKFVITDSGDVRDVTIVRGIGAGCDEEAARIIKSMGKWKPGKQNGKPVNVYYSIAVTFFPQDPKEENKK